MFDDGPNARVTGGRTATSALDRAIARDDWEAAALYVLVAFARMVRETPAATLDDLLSALAGEDGDAAASR
jgi:hypothetical protein